MDIARADHHDIRSYLQPGIQDSLRGQRPRIVAKNLLHRDPHMAGESLDADEGPTIIHKLIVKNPQHNRFFS